MDYVELEIHTGKKTTNMEFLVTDLKKNAQQVQIYLHSWLKKLSNIKKKSPFTQSISTTPIYLVKRHHSTSHHPDPEIMLNMLRSMCMRDCGQRGGMSQGRK